MPSRISHLLTDTLQRAPTPETRRTVASTELLRTWRWCHADSAHTYSTSAQTTRDEPVAPSPTRATNPKRIRSGRGQRSLRHPHLPLHFAPPLLINFRTSARPLGSLQYIAFSPYVPQDWYTTCPIADSLLCALVIAFHVCLSD